MQTKPQQTNVNADMGMPNGENHSVNTYMVASKIKCPYGTKEVR